MATIDKYSQLKIAANVLGTTIRAIADEVNVSTQTVRGVCDGTITSAKVSEQVNNKIAEAEKIYEQHRRNSKMQSETT